MKDPDQGLPEELENEDFTGGHTVRQGFLALGDLAESAGPGVEVVRPAPTVSAVPDVPQAVQRSLPEAGPALRPPPPPPRSPTPAPSPIGPPGSLSRVPREQRPAPRPRDAVPLPVPSTRPPVVFRSQSSETLTLSGTTLRDKAAREAAPARGTQQRTRTILRLAAPRPTSPRDGHRAEIRAVVFYDGADVVRYGVYRDPDQLKGFDGSGRMASFSVELREVLVVHAGGASPAVVQLRYSGTVSASGWGELAFEGQAQLDGSGTVLAGPPTITAGAGRTGQIDGVATVGWW